MSRSWTSAGLALGRERVELACLGARGKVELFEAQPLAARLFCGPPAAQAQERLAQALRSLAGRIARRFVPLHVSLPDAAVRYACFELDEMPAARSARLELARFRFARQGMDAESACAAQPLGREAGRALLFGMAIESAWQRLVVQALAQAGLRAWSLSANICRQWNRFHGRLACSSGALVALSPDAWSLWLWDQSGRPRYVRARWRAGQDDHAEIAQEVERSILAYVHGGAERDVAGVFVSAEAEVGAMGEALDARLREPCTRLEATPGAVAAAFER